MSINILNEVSVKHEMINLVCMKCQNSLDLRYTWCQLYADFSTPTACSEPYGLEISYGVYPTLQAIELFADAHLVLVYLYILSYLLVFCRWYAR